MPPSTQPIPVQILDLLEAALALPDGGSSYWYDVNVVRVGESVLDQIVEPAIVIGDVGVMGRYFEEKAGSVLWHSNLHWRLPVYGVVPYSSSQAEANRNLLRLVDDIYSATATLNGVDNSVILELVFVGFEVIAPPTDGDARPWIACELDIHFRTRDTHMRAV